MTRDQVKYAVRRIEDILKEKIDKSRNEFKITPVRFSLEKKIKLLQEGKFTVVDLKSNHWRPSLDNVIIFEGEVLDLFDNEGFKKKEAELIKRAFEIKDELMLGNNEEALKLIAKFEKE